MPLLAIIVRFKERRFKVQLLFTIGVLACLDSYMNIALEQTEEYVNGQVIYFKPESKNKIGFEVYCSSPPPLYTPSYTVHINHKIKNSNAYKAAVEIQRG